MSKTFVCPVCGYAGLFEPARLPAGGGSYEICWSCGFEFGVTDEDEGYTYAEWRQLWIDRGMPFDGAALHPVPEGWDPRAQLADLLAGRSKP